MRMLIHVHIEFCLLIGVAVHLCGCASGRRVVSTNHTQPGKASVRKVDFSEAPEVKELAERARRVGNEMYPRVLAVLADATSKLPKQFDIIFKKHTWRGNPGVTLGNRIRLNAGWVAKNPAGLEMVLVHEMAHVAGHYRWYYWFRTPSYWSEGMADYARFKLGYTNGWRCPQCSVEFPHFTSGYSCAGAFLLFMDATYGSNVVRQLNAELRQGRYSDRFFAKATGRNLGELWEDFLKSPAATPVAADATRLYGALGYANGKPPWNVQARFRAYLKQHGNTNQLLLDVAGEMKGKPLKDVFRVYAFLQNFEDAAAFLESLDANGQLPGFIKGGLEEIRPGTSNPDDDCEPAPITRTFTCAKAGDPSGYHYVVVRESRHGLWRLRQAWRTGPDGRVIEEYPIP